MDALRVLQVLEPTEGGLPAQVKTLARGLIEQGHEVDAMVARRDGTLASDLRALGAGVAERELHTEIVAAMSDLRAARALAATLRSGRWDVVHTHGDKAGVFGRAAARLTGVPLVHSPHGFAYVSQRWRPRAGQGLRRALTFGIEKGLAPWADAIVCSSEADRQEAIRDGLADSERLVTVHYGIDPVPAVDPDPRLVDGGDGVPLVGFMARLHEQKAPLVLVDALRLMRDRDIGFRAALVGTGPLEEVTRGRIAEQDLDDLVAVVPFTGEVAPALAAFDLYVLPSLWESLPIGILEAMSAGLPVVASSVAGVPEEVEHERTGLLVEPGDAGALADAIGRLVRDAGLRRSMGEAGRQVCRERFTVDRMVARMVAVYRRAVA
jgi:glycosyltransferase involved in cell wall biosynthesis